jgi:glycine betaine/choline ABC-type transport system substrate-binding protein
VIRQQMLEQYPELKGLINRIPALVSNQTLKHLTYQVDVERRDVFEVVRSWLKQKQLL